MKSLVKRSILLLFSASLIALSLVFSTACEPVFKITATNNTNITLFLAVMDEPTAGIEYAIGEVAPGSTLVSDKKFPIILVAVDAIVIIGRNEAGVLAYNKRFTRSEWIRMGQKLTIIQSDLLAPP